MEGSSSFGTITLDDGSIDLAYDDEVFGNGEDLNNIGWGVTATSSTANVLQEAEFDYISNEICQSAWGDSIKDDQLCVFRENVSACNGDSGGPLFLESQGVYVQVGKLQNILFKKIIVIAVL